MCSHKSFLVYFFYHVFQYILFFRCCQTGKYLAMYHLASLLTSNCIPNSTWLIQHPSLQFYLRATTPIKTGERLSISFVDPLLATHQRREVLWNEKYLLCTCSRCSCPTECSTFFAAVKCPGRRSGEQEDRNNGVLPSECEGYLLPTDPLAVTYTLSHCCSSSGSEDGFPPGEEFGLEKMTEWKCNVCLMRQPWAFVETERLEKIRRIFVSEEQPERERSNACFTSNIGNDVYSSETLLLDSLEARVDKIDSLVGNLVHANHNFVVKMENEILTDISGLLERGQVPFDQMEKWALRMINFCKKGLKIVNILCPGNSFQRGKCKQKPFQFSQTIDLFLEK